MKVKFNCLKIIKIKVDQLLKFNKNNNYEKIFNF